jgi:hypothetical protein
LNLPALRELKLIAVAATGTDIIDKQAAAKKGVKVCNVPGYASQSVAQFTMALILELASRASSYAAAVKAGEWQQSPVFTLLNFPNIELSGKKLGIIGFGNIGRTVAQMARGFGMEILVGARPENTGRISPLAELFRSRFHLATRQPRRNLINRLGFDEAKRISITPPAAPGRQPARFSRAHQRIAAAASCDRRAAIRRSRSSALRRVGQSSSRPTPPGRRGSAAAQKSKPTSSISRDEPRNLVAHRTDIVAMTIMRRAGIPARRNLSSPHRHPNQRRRFG